MCRTRGNFCRFALIFLLILGVQTTHAADDAFRVIASIKPVHSILAALMKGGDEPELLVKGAATPYDYQLTEEQKQHLAKADLVFWVGPELEAFLQRPLAEQVPGREVYQVLDDPRLKVLPSRQDEARRDPYFWLDSRNGLILIDDLTRILMNADPVRAHLYRRNRDEIFRRAAEMDRVLEYGYRGMKGGVVLLYHDTQLYFEQAYAMKAGMVLMPLPPRPVDAGRLLQARAALAEGKFSCVLAESGLPEKELSLLTDGIEVNVGLLDSLGTRLEPGPDLYIKLMEYNTDVIRDCVKLTKADAGQVEAEPISTGQIGGRFLMTSHNGALVTEDDLLGHYSLLYFGYTFCPDICPTSLQTISLALDQLGDKAKQIRPYFITIDPERDTVEKMRNYVQYFNDDLIGLVGSKEMTDRMAKAYKVRYEKVLEEGTDPELYLMDHTASVYLIGPDGKFITKFAHGITPQAMAQRLREYLK